MLVEVCMKKILFILICSFIINLCPFNVLAETDDNLIKGAVSGVLMEAETGKILFEKEKDKKVAIASMTKMVAQIIILEKINAGVIKWDDVVTVSKNAADMGGSQIYIAEGEKITIENLMKGISMASGNDATVAMAEVISGTEEKFVKLMNDKVKKLGLKNTVFKNCTGLDEDGHYSTAYDMAVIARELVTKYPEIFRFSSVYEDYLRENTKDKFWLVNTNKLVHFYEGADGLKTGHTDNAGYCLAATAKRNGIRLISIVLGENNASIRNSESMQLLDYGFQHLKIKKLKDKGTLIKTIEIDKANNNMVEIVLKDDLGVIEEINNNDYKYTYKVIINKMELPLKKQETVGRIDVYNGDKVVASEDLIVKQDVLKLNLFQLFGREFLELASGKI